MKMADILRNIADELDNKEGDKERSELPGNVERGADKFLHKVDDVAHPDRTDPKTMIPPLQQKIELLKKASGEPNAFDDGVGHGDEEHEPEDELARLKKIAGLTVMIDGEQGEMGE